MEHMYVSLLASEGVFNYVQCPGCGARTWATTTPSGAIRRWNGGERLALGYVLNMRKREE
jgi:ribosomal protein S27E